MYGGGSLTLTTIIIFPWLGLKFWHTDPQVTVSGHAPWLLNCTCSTYNWPTYTTTSLRFFTGYYFCTIRLSSLVCISDVQELPTEICRSENHKNTVMIGVIHTSPVLCKALSDHDGGWSGPTLGYLFCIIRLSNLMCMSAVEMLPTEICRSENHKNTVVIGVIHTSMVLCTALSDHDVSWSSPTAVY